MEIITKAQINFSLDSKEADTLHQFINRCLETMYNVDSDFIMDAKETALLAKMMFGIEKSKVSNIHKQ